MKNFIRLSLVLAVLALSSPAYAVDVPRTPTAVPMGKDTVVFTWTGLDGDDTGIPVETSQCRDLSVHIYSGTYGGSTITLEGSNDPLAAPTTSTYNTTAEWAGLAEPGGTAISKVADAFEQVQDHPRFFRPKTASGTGADIAVGLVCRK